MRINRCGLPPTKGGGAMQQFLLEIINILFWSFITSLAINIALLTYFLINLSRKQ